MKNQIEATPRPWATDGPTTNDPKDLTLLSSFDLITPIAQFYRAEDAELVRRVITTRTKPTSRYSFRNQTSKKL